MEEHRIRSIRGAGQTVMQAISFADVVVRAQRRHFVEVEEGYSKPRIGIPLVLNQVFGHNILV